MGPFSTIERPWKPFNPILGETFEFAKPDKGVKYIAEQVGLPGQAERLGWLSEKKGASPGLAEMKDACSMALGGRSQDGNRAESAGPCVGACTSLCRAIPP